MSWYIPEIRASEAPLLSRVGCRCAGTSRPVHRSRVEAAAPCRSTGTAASPEAHRGPPTPALVRVCFAITGQKNGEMSTTLQRVCTEQARVSVRGRTPTLPLFFSITRGFSGAAFRDSLKVKSANDGNERITNKKCWPIFFNK